MVLVPIFQDLAEMDCIYALNELGAAMWELLGEPHSRASLQQAILETYDAQPEVLQADLDVFLQDMLAAGTIVEVH